jgi:hypothetical protein
MAKQKLTALSGQPVGPTRIGRRKPVAPMPSSLTNMSKQLAGLPALSGQPSAGQEEPAVSLGSLTNPVQSNLAGDMQLPTTNPNLSGQSGDMQPPVSSLPDSEEKSTTIQDLIGQFQTQADAANQANEQRYSQGMGIFDQLVGMYQPGGSFGQGMMGQYQQVKEQALASQYQGMVSSGLANTTTAAGMNSAYEQRVGTPFRMQLADLMTEKLSGAMQAKAGFIERREDVPPSPELMANLVTQAEAGPDTNGSGGGDGSGAAGSDTSDSSSKNYFGYGGSGSYSGGGDPNAPISQVQYRMEGKRQRLIQRHTNRVSRFEKRLRRKQKQLNRYSQDDPKRDKLEDQIADLESKINESQDQLDNNYDPIVPSGAYAREQESRRKRKAAAEKAEADRSRKLSESRGRYTTSGDSGSSAAFHKRWSLTK